MGKAAMCIRMLQILNTGRIYKISELAELLQTSPRNVIEYKKELNEVATESNYEFYIRNVPGRYGGYVLDGNAVLPSLNFNAAEKESLVEAINYLSSRNDFMKKDYLQVAIGKIISSISMNEIKKEENMTIINRFPLAMKQEDIQFRYDTLLSGINNKKVVEFTYLNQKNEIKKRVFDPYELFMYNNAWFVIGWQHNDEVNDVRWFKLNRILEIKKTDKRFTPWSYFQRQDYIDEYGFKSNGEWYHVEFVAYGTYASLVKERIYGKNQVVEPLDDNSTKVSVDMQNKESIRVFVLGFGNNVTVIEPQWLKDDLVDIGKKLIEKY